MKTPDQIKNSIVDYINNNSFNINYTTQNDSCYVKNKFGAYLLDFYVYYNQAEKNYVSADYLQPEESDVEYSACDIDNVNVYINNEVQELTEEIYEEIKNALYIKIIHNK